jgi:three-Cys-motif partner protein
MSSKKLTTIWKAEPHTIAKIDLLSAYLKAWFSILGTKPPRRNAELLYVDGFAGPGEYTNHPTGSPIVALEAATSALNTHGARWKAGDIYCAFVELDPARTENLERKLSTVESHARVHASTYAATFVDGLIAIKAARPRSFSQAYPLFVFIDPFGATGAPFTAVAEILSSPSSEVLINLDADGIARIFRAGDDANRDILLTKVFGDTSWQESLSFNADFVVQCRQALELYKRRLRTLPGIRYVFAFEMRGIKDSINYFLVFASGHPLGLEKMKEAMKSIDQSGAYTFCDANVRQSLLFRFDDPEEFARQLFERHKGKRVPHDELHDYALNDTPFANPKRMLKWIEENDLIESVELLPGKTRRRGTFSEDAVRAIIFRQGVIHAQG